jgi:hypothetical protein
MWKLSAGGPSLKHSSMSRFTCGNKTFGEHPVKPGRVSHNKEFTDKCESLGLHPMPSMWVAIPPLPTVYSLNLWKNWVSPALRMCHGWSGQKPEGNQSGGTGSGQKKKRADQRFTSGSALSAALAVRIGIKDDPRLVHDVCSEKKGEKVFLVNARWAKIAHDL